MGWFDDFFKGTDATAPQATFAQNPQYSNVAPVTNSMWDYLGKGMEALQAGKPPTWFQNWAPIEESQRRNALLGSYYGRNASGMQSPQQFPSMYPGQGSYGVGSGQGNAGAGTQLGSRFSPGILESQQAGDVRAGRRGAGAGSNYAKQLDQYAKADMEITDYLSKLGADSMNQAEQRYLSAGASLPQGPQGQWFQSQGTPYQPSGFESLMQGVGGIAPYAMMALGGNPMSAGGNPFGQIGNALGGASTNSWLTPQQPQYSSSSFGYKPSDFAGSGTGSFGGFEKNIVNEFDF